MRLTAVGIATVDNGNYLCASVGALSGDVVEVDVGGVLSSAKGREGGDESEL
jgi:hypothetical protein